MFVKDAKSLFRIGCKFYISKKNSMTPPNNNIKDERFYLYGYELPSSALKTTIDQPSKLQAPSNDVLSTKKTA